MPAAIKDRAFEILERLASTFEQPAGVAALETLKTLASQCADLEDALGPHMSALHEVVMRSQGANGEPSQG